MAILDHFYSKDQQEYFVRKDYEPRPLTKPKLKFLEARCSYIEGLLKKAEENGDVDLAEECKEALTETEQILDRSLDREMFFPEDLSDADVMERTQDAAIAGKQLAEDYHFSGYSEAVGYAITWAVYSEVKDLLKRQGDCIARRGVANILLPFLDGFKHTLRIFDIDTKKDDIISKWIEDKINQLYPPHVDVKIISKQNKIRKKN